MAQRAGTNQQEEPTNSESSFVLKLFITGASPNSMRAITNLRVILEKYLKDNHTLEIIDVYQQGSIAVTEQIIAMPVLIKKLPLPEKRLIGDMSDETKVLRGLGLI